MLYVTGTARVSQAPVLRATDKGTIMTTVNVAWSDNRAGSDESSFVQLIAFGTVAELLADRVVGEKIGVQGRLQIKNNKTNGTTYTNTTVVMDRIDFETSRDERDALLAKRVDAAAGYVLTEKGEAEAVKTAPVVPDFASMSTEQLKAFLPRLQEFLASK